MRFLSIASISLIVFSWQVEAFKVCGDDVTYVKETDDAITEIVNRLMALRNTDWNWKFIQTPMALQLVATEKFYGREKTVEAIKQKVKNEVNEMSLWDFSLHTIAAKGLCQNVRNFSGVDLIKVLEEKLKGQFRFKQLEPVDGLPTYAVGLSALCTSDILIPRYLINKLLVNQNKDGSFGTTTKIVNTAMLLPPMNCLSKELHPKYRVERVTNAIKKMREYIKSNIYTDNKNHTYIGSPYASAFALLGLQATQEPRESPNSWKCSEVMRSLGFQPEPNEPERMLVSRLLRISGHRYGDFGNPEWKCIEPDPTPVGYLPRCVPTKPETCQITEE